jgi:hypothetical protein
MAYDLQLSLLHRDSFPRVERELLTVEICLIAVVENSQLGDGMAHVATGTLRTPLWLCLQMGISGSASFQSARRSLSEARVPTVAA